MIHVVILAGGQGSRFWPMSRIKKPKQFLSLGKDKDSLIQATVKRVGPLLKAGKLWVVTNEVQAPLVREHVPEATIVIEPMAKNTAPSIALATAVIAKEDPKGIMIVLPADHSVSNDQALIMILNEATKIAEKSDKLVTVGVKPNLPNTGYGYIKKGEKIEGNAYKVGRFFEKPNLERAKEYLESGNFLWNSGMFIWNLAAIEKAFQEHLSGVYDNVILPIKEGRILLGDVKLKEAFSLVESVSVDIGILEHSRNCAVIAGGDFGWSDVGSWDAWANNFKPDALGNLVHGDALLLESSGCVVHSEKKFTAIVGAKDLIVIDTGDALLICDNEHVQDVRKVVASLQEKNRTDLI